MQKFLKWLWLLSVAGVFIFVFAFVYDIYKSDENIKEPKPLVFEVKITTKDHETKWLDKIKNKQIDKNDRLPVEEVVVKASLIKKNIKKIKLYKVEVNSLDPYQIFCLQEELNRFGVKYVFAKSKTDTKLYVVSKNVKKLKKLADALKRYNIIATIKFYKEVSL